MQKRERLERAIAGESVDRVPVALWRHWPGDDQRAADLASSTALFHRLYDWDFVRMMPSSHYLVLDYGLQDIWDGAPSGERKILKYPIKRSLDWTALRTLDPQRGELAKQIEALRLLCEALKDHQVPIIQTIYSPLAQAQRLAGQNLTLQHMRMHYDRLRTGLNTLTETTLRYIEALRRLPIDGICYVIEHADFQCMSEIEYAHIGAPFDHKILETIPSKWWLNILQVDSPAPMLNYLCQYNMPAINWTAQEGREELSRVRAMFKGAVCGGITSEQLYLGTPTSVRDEARAAITQTDGRRFILAVGSKVPVATPISNIRAVREIVES